MWELNKENLTWLGQSIGRALVKLMSVEEPKQLSSEEAFNRLGPVHFFFFSTSRFLVACTAHEHLVHGRQLIVLRDSCRGSLHVFQTTCFCHRATCPSIMSCIHQYRKHFLDSCSRNVRQLAAQWKSHGTDPESS